MTRTDAGEGTTNSTGTVTIEDGQTERTGNFNGSSEATATAVYSHRGSYGEDSPSGLPAYEDSGSGTLTTKVNTSYTGDSKSTGYDSTFTLTVGATQNSTEDSTYTVGWTQQGVDTAGQDFYTGEVATETVQSSGNTSSTMQVTGNSGQGTVAQSSPSSAAGEGLGEGATSVEVTLTGGSNRSTEQNTYRKWDYRAKDDFFSRLDEATQSTVTTRSGADGEGNPSLSQSIVNLREYDFYSQSIDDEPYGGYTRYEERTTQRNHEASRDSQTATVSGPEDERRHKLAIDHAFASLDENAVSYLWETVDGDSYTLTERDSYWRTEKSDNSTYRSTHLVGENGLARDGQFSASSSSSVVVTAPHAPVSQDPAFNRQYHDSYEPWDGQHQQYGQRTETAGLISRVTTTTVESGAYYDVSVLGLFAFRVQSGDYKIDQRAQSETRHKKDEYLFNRPVAGGGSEDYEVRTTDQLASVRLNSQVVTTGSYGRGGITESREYRDTTTDRGHYHRRSDYYLDSADDEWIEQHSTWSLNTQNHNGTISGHDYIHLWGSGDPDVTDPVTSAHVASYNYVTDEDIFGGTPPSGPQPVETSTQPYTAESLDGGIFSVPDERREPQVIEPSWWVGVKAGFGYLWEEHKAWDNEEVVENYNNMRGTEHGRISSGLVGFLGSVGERLGAGGLANAVEGRDKAGTQLTTRQRWWHGLTGGAEVALNGAGLRGAGQGIKKGAEEGFKIVKAGLERADEAFNALKGLLRGKADDAAKQGGKAAKPVTGAVKKASRVWPKHHPFPKYLGGAVDQTLKKIPRKLHYDFHAALDKFKGGKYARRHSAEHFKDMNRDEIINDLTEFYKNGEGSKFRKYLPDFLNAVEESTK